MFCKTLSIVQRNMLFYQLRNVKQLFYLNVLFLCCVTICGSNFCLEMLVDNQGNVFISIKARDFVFSKLSRPVLEPTQPPV